MHVADLHLDTPFIGMGNKFGEIQKDLLAAAMTAFERLVTVAINRQVDVMLVVGDVYNAQKQTISAQHFFQKQLQRLEKVAIPVIVLHGNHDFLTEKMARRQYPENVHVLKDTTVSYVDIPLKTGETARFYGFSYQTQWVQDRKIGQYPSRDGQADYVIGMLHGSMDTLDSHAGNYAPFTIKELRDKHYDYWALGHIHKRQVLHETPMIIYPGTIQGRHRHEDGPKGAYLVTLEKGQTTQLEFIDAAPIQWEKVEIECQHHMQASDLSQRLEGVMENYASHCQADGKSFILDVTFTQAQRLDSDLTEQVQQGELKAALSITRQGDYFVLVSQIHLQSEVNAQAFNYDPELQESFHSAVQQLSEEDKVYHDLLRPLADHPVIHDYLQDLLSDEEFKTAVIRAGQEQVIHSLGFDMEVGDEDED